MQFRWGDFTLRGVPWRYTCNHNRDPTICRTSWQDILTPVSCWRLRRPTRQGCIGSAAVFTSHRLFTFTGTCHLTATHAWLPSNCLGVSYGVTLATFTPSFSSLAPCEDLQRLLCAPSSFSPQYRQSVRKVAFCLSQVYLLTQLTSRMGKSRAPAING